MKVDIEKYRGFEIEFCTKEEVFFAYSNSYDSESNSKSLSGLKTKLDKFLKDNDKFPVTYIEAMPNGYVQQEILKLIGIRKDNRFIYEGKDGKKEQLSEYDEKNYILRNENNDEFRESASKIDLRINELRIEKNKILEQVKGIPLKEFKNNFLSK